MRGMEAARSKSERASVNTKMFRAGKFLRTNQCQYQRTLGKILTPFLPRGEAVLPPSSFNKKKNIFFKKLKLREKA